MSNYTTNSNNVKSVGNNSDSTEVLSTVDRVAGSCSVQYCNTAPVRQPGRGLAVKCEVSIDWYQFTLPHRVVREFESSEGLDVMGLSNWLGIPVKTCSDGVSRFGYTNAASLDGMGGAFVLWGGVMVDDGNGGQVVSTNGTAHIQLSGSALRHFISYGMDLHKLMAKVDKYGGKVKRIDIALDDRMGILSQKTMLDAALEGNIMSRFKNKNNPTYIGNGAHNEGLDWTLYFGSKGGKAMVRVYNKSAERGLSSDMHWVRIEAEFRREKAQAVASELIRSYTAGTCVGIVRGVIDFRDKDTATRATNRKLLPWWAEFTGDCEIVRHSAVRNDTPTIEGVMDAVREQWGPYLTAIREKLGDEEFFRVMGLVASEHDRVRDKHKGVSSSSDVVIDDSATGCAGGGYTPRPRIIDTMPSNERKQLDKLSERTKLVSRPVNEHATDTARFLNEAMPDGRTRREHVSDAINRGWPGLPK